MKSGEFMGRNKILIAALSVIFLVSLFLRFNSLNCGLPSKTARLSSFHFDEYMTFGALGGMNPSKLDFFPGEAVMCWGSFQVYSVGAILKAMQITGIFNPAGKDEMRKNLAQADKMYYAGRIFTGLFSILSPFLIFLIVRREIGESAALWASAFFASFYVEIYTGSIVKPDSIMLFWGILSFYFLRGWIIEKKDRNFYLAAFFAGLSFATKYTGIIFAINFLASFFIDLRNEERKLLIKKFFTYFLIVAAVFFIVNPYFLIAPEKSLPHFLGMFEKTKAQGSVLKGYIEYFTQILPVSYSLPAVLLFLFSFFHTFKSRENIMIYCLVFCLFYIVKFGYPLHQAFTYSLPMAPFFALLAGNFAAKGGRAAVIFCAAVLVYSFSYSFYQKAMWKDENTIFASSRWIEGNIPHNKTVCLSRIDIWTPTVLRAYDTPYRIKVFGEAKTNFGEGLRDMLLNSDLCDFIVLSEYESRIIDKNPPLKLLKSEALAGFERKYEIKRPSSPLFEITDSHHYLFASFMNPGFEIFQRGKNGSKRNTALLKRNGVSAFGALESF